MVVIFTVLGFAEGAKPSVIQATFYMCLQKPGLRFLRSFSGSTRSSLETGNFLWWAHRCKTEAHGGLRQTLQQPEASAYAAGENTLRASRPLDESCDRRSLEQALPQSSWPVRKHLCEAVACTRKHVNTSL